MKFGEISNRRVTTPPDRLVRDVFQYNCRPNIPYQCQVRLQMEPVIIGKYIQHQENNGHEGITVKNKGLVIDKDNPVLAAGVDGEVSDPTNKYHPIGYLEAKYKLFPSKLKWIQSKLHYLKFLQNTPRISAWRLQNQESDSNKNIHTINKFRGVWQ